MVKMFADQPATPYQSQNNLKQLMLAFHNYHDTFGHFPSDICDEKGKPLLSWRVAILPYIEQEALYRQFKLNEPWDSAHNKKLSEIVVKAYHAPLQKTDSPTKTTYLMPTGPGLAGEIIKDTVQSTNRKMPDKTIYRGIKLREMTDGTSNTIVIVEADDDQAVIWSKPGDLKIDKTNPIKNLKQRYTKGFLAAIGDGSVQMIAFKNRKPEVFFGLFTYKGGEVVNLD
jgi:hypothetical protein